MVVLIVFAHPERRSFNGALFDTAVRTLTDAGHVVTTSDLYRMEFDPVSDRRNFRTVKDPDYLRLQAEETLASEQAGFAPDLEAEIAKLEACDLLLFQFPLWWFGLPAILKGWVDRVLVMGRIYGNGRLYADGRFKGKRAMLSLTTGGPAGAYVADGFNGDIQGILRPIHRGILQFIGFDVLAPQIHYGPVRADEAQRAAWLAAYGQRLERIAEEKPIDVGRYQ